MERLFQQIRDAVGDNGLAASRRVAGYRRKYVVSQPDRYVALPTAFNWPSSAPYGGPWIIWYIGLPGVITNEHGSSDRHLLHFMRNTPVEISSQDVAEDLAEVLNQALSRRVNNGHEPVS